MRRHALAMKKEDNVATAIRDIAAGEAAIVGIDDDGLSIPVLQDIGLGHKLALRAIRKGEGHSEVRHGDRAAPRRTSHAARMSTSTNVESTRGRGDLA